MKSDRHNQIMELFLAATELQGERRHEYLEESCGGDEQLRREVDQLLGYHSPETILVGPPMQVLPREPARRRTAWRGRIGAAGAWGTPASRQAIVAAVVLTMFLTGLFWWVHQGVSRSLRDNTQAQLQTNLDGDVATLRKWIAQEKAVVESWAENEELRDLVAELVRVSKQSLEPRDELLKSPAYDAVIRLLEPVHDRQGVVGVGIVSRDGVTLVHVRSDEVGTGVAPSSAA